MKLVRLVKYAGLKRPVVNKGIPLVAVGTPPKEIGAPVPAVHAGVPLESGQGVPVFRQEVTQFRIGKFSLRAELEKAQKNA